MEVVMNTEDQMVLISFLFCYFHLFHFSFFIYFFRWFWYGFGMVLDTLFLTFLLLLVFGKLFLVVFGCYR